MSDSAFDIFNAEDTERYRRQHRLDPEVIRRFRNRLFKRFLPDEDALQELSAADNVNCHALELSKAVDSEVDGATRLLFRTQNEMSYARA